MNDEGKVEFLNEWIKEIVQPSSAQNDISVSSSSPSNENDKIPDEVREVMLTLQAINAMLNDIQSKGYSLAKYMKEDEGNIRPLIFDYKKGEKTYKFTIKDLTLDFNKKQCRTLIIDDHTPFYELSRLEDKYQKIFIASVVHDIRTPIQGVMGVLDMLDTPEKNAEEKEFIEIGKNTCSLLNCLTHDITDLGQIEANKLKIVQGQFSALDTLNECIKLMSFSYRSKGIFLEKNFDRSLTYQVYSDKHRYMQILINLLGNALKFTFKGGVTVSLRMDPIADLLITEIKDTGIGIKSDEIPQLFKLFGKLESSSAINPQGVGLGLTICKKLSEAMGGSIEATSEYGVGTSFIFSITINSAKALSNSPRGTAYMFEEEKEYVGVNPTHLLGDYSFFQSPASSHLDPNNVLFYLNLFAQRTSEESKQLRKLSKNCNCSQLLIVDDNPSIVFIMKAYMRSMKIACEEVSNGFYSIGHEWRRGN